MHIFILGSCKVQSFMNFWLIMENLQWQCAYWIVSKFLNPTRHNRVVKSFILQSSHVMILNSTKFGGNRTKDVEVGPDKQTDSYIPPYTMFPGGVIRLWSYEQRHVPAWIVPLMINVWSKYDEPRLYGNVENDPILKMWHCQCRCKESNRQWRDNKPINLPINKISQNQALFYWSKCNFKILVKLDDRNWRWYW